MDHQLQRGLLATAHHPKDSACDESRAGSKRRPGTEDLIHTVHAHPTMHEGVHEAALDSEGRVIHT